MYRWIVLLAVLAPLVSGCGEAATVPETMPEDFRLVYLWREGSLPPPYHYEYRITLAPDGAGLIEFWPDYPSATTPLWSEPFSVSAETRQGLYAIMRTAGVWGGTWQESNPPRVGGSTATLEALAHGTAALIPGDLIDDQARRMAPVYAAIQQLVPQPLWESLHTKRQQYEDTYQP